MTPAVPAAHLGTARMPPQRRWKSIIVVMSKGKDTFGNICLHFNGLFGSHDGFLFSLSPPASSPPLSSVLLVVPPCFVVGKIKSPVTARSAISNSVDPGTPHGP